MKYIKYLTILLILISFGDAKALSINLDDNKNINNNEVEAIEITSLNNINKISNYPNVKEVLIKKVNIKDISFLNNLNKLNKVEIYYSKVDLSELSNNYLNELYIISSKIVDDNFNSLKKLNIAKLDLEGSYVTTINSLKNTVSLKELTLSSISNLRSIDIITTLLNLKKLNIGGSEELINSTVFNYIKEKNIIGDNYSNEDYMNLNGVELNKKLDEILDNLNLDNLSEIDKIKTITIYVADNMEYDDDCFYKNICANSEIGFNMLLKSLKGIGVCYHYALFTNKLLNKAGIKSYLVGGYTTKGLGHEWLNIYLDDKWYGLDPTWIDLYELDKLKNTGKSSYFMIELNENNTFYKNHLEDVLPSSIVNPNEVIVDIAPFNNVDNSYENTFIVFVCTLILIVIIYIYIKLIKRK